ncbi:Adenylate cyclase [Diplonema papillatum]|nr:Adenylate cyclase [Diplonema papillatum]
MPSHAVTPYDAEKAARKKDRKKPSGLSIRLVFPAISAAALALAVAISVTLVSRTYDNALDDAYERNVAELGAVITLTEELTVATAVTLQSAMMELLISQMSDTVGDTFNMLGGYVRVVDQDLVLSPQPKNTLAFFEQTGFAMYNLIEERNGSIPIAVGVDLDLYYCVVLNKFGPPRRGGYLLLEDVNDTVTQVHVSTDNFTIGPRLMSLSFSLLDDIAQKMTMNGVFAHNERFWLKTRYYTDVQGVIALYNYIDPVSGASLSVRSYYSGRDLTNMLQAILRQVSTGKQGENMTLFAVHDDDPILDRFAPDDTYHRTLYNSSGTITASSSGEDSYRYNETYFAFYLDVEHPDPVVRSSAKAIRQRGGYETAVNNPYLAQLDELNATYLLQTGLFQTEVPGFRMWIVFSLPLESLTGTMKEAIREKKANVAHAQQAQEDNVATQRAILLAVTVPIAMAIAGVVALITVYMVAPIKRLQEEMALVAEMKLEQQDAKMSSLLEVHSMQLSFNTMVRKLKEFKAYVPNAVLQKSADEMGGYCAVEPPSGLVSFVFTDIQGSTALWEKSPGDMDVALETHNQLMREAASKFEGYEVKTIGDSFMLAFKDPVAALKFAFKAQKMMLEEKWPSDLELNVFKGKDGKPKFGGMRVRMGAHCGIAVLEENPITGRSDYRGGVVNMASRVEGKAKAGTLCVTDSFLKAVRPALSSSDPEATGCWVDHGEHSLKGLGDHRLYLVASAEYSERIEAGSDIYRVDVPGTSPHNTMKRSRSGSDVTRSSGKDSTRVTGDVHPTKKTGLFLQQLEATVAVCKLLEVSDGRTFETCNQVVRCASDAASLTDGSVVSLCGSALIVAWNTVKTCRNHPSAALQFASEVDRRCRAAIVRIGVATGLMHYGNVGTINKRFSTVTGKCVTVAMMAADMCQQFNTFCLVADFTVNSMLTSRSNTAALLRLVDMWLDVAMERKVPLYEFFTSKLKDIESIWEALDDSEHHRHTALFKEAMSGSENALRIFNAAAESDATLKVVLSNLLSMPSPSSFYRLIVDLSCPFAPASKVFTPTAGHKHTKRSLAP